MIRYGLERSIAVSQWKKRELNRIVRGQSIWVFVVVCIMILLTMVASARFATHLDGLKEEKSGVWNSGWYYLRDQSPEPLAQLPCTLEYSGQTLVLQHDLTEETEHPANVAVFRTRYASITVWADDTVIYEAAQGEAHALSSMWHFVPLSECRGASTMTVEMRAYDGRTSWQLESVLLDTPPAIEYTLIKENMAPLVFGCICLLLTAVIFFFAVILAVWRSPTYLPVLSLALFVFLSGLWILLDSKINTLWGGNFASTYFLSYAAFYLLMIPYLRYIQLMLKYGSRILSLLICLFTVNAVLCFILHLTGLVQLRDTAVAVHILIVVSLPISTWIFWHSVVVRKERQLRFTFIGTLVIYGCGLISIVLYHQGLLNVVNNTSLYILGLSILLVAMSADAIASFGRFWWQKESAERYRRLAVEDSMTFLGNRNAFQLRMSDLLKNPPTYLAFVVFDVDNLKQINDQKGHYAGDQMIYLAAQYIREVFSSVGNCYRIGGDEFAVIITGKAVNRIPVLLSKFNRTIEIHWNDMPGTTGVSYGWAAEYFHEKKSLTEESLIELRNAADRSLYQMKHGKKARESN